MKRLSSALLVTAGSIWSLGRADLNTFEVQVASIHEVQVGGDSNKFSPAYVNASIGDIVRFKLSDGNHSVSQSSYERPCHPSGPFDTSFLSPQHRNVDLLVTTTDPQWFYCRQDTITSHCMEGMVFVINPNSHWDGFLCHTEPHSLFLSSTYTSATTSKWPAPRLQLSTTSGSLTVPPTTGTSLAFVGSPTGTYSHILSTCFGPAQSFPTASGKSERLSATASGCYPPLTSNASWTWPYQPDTVKPTNIPLTGHARGPARPRPSCIAVLELFAFYLFHRALDI